MPRGKQYQDISRKIAETKQRGRKLDEIEVLLNWISEALEDPEASFTLIRSRLARVIRLGRECGLEISPVFTREITVIDQASDILREMNRLFDKHYREAQRARMPKPPPVAPRLCINCMKREHHYVIDGKDYCKRCADELGIRPTGKVI